MCLIAVAVNEQVLDEESLVCALSGNQDGFGFVADVSGELRAARFPGAEHRGGRDYREAFTRRLREWRSAATGQIAVHLRQRTSGPCDEATAHPFPVETGKFSGFLLHNGVFQVAALVALAERLDTPFPEEAGLSDTAALVRILESAHLDAGEMESVLVREVQRSPFNRVVTWNREEVVPKIFNLGSGIVSADQRHWYSNDWYFNAGYAPQ